MRQREREGQRWRNSIIKKKKQSKSKRKQEKQKKLREREAKRGRYIEG